MTTTFIKQRITFTALSENVYGLIMDAKKHADFTGSPVTMNTKVNGKFRIFNGYCTGYNIELIKGKKIVQAWHFKEDGWPDGHFSICNFVFEQSGDKTTLLFLQTGVPAHKAVSLKAGWKQYYWEPMKAYLKYRKDE